MQFSAKKVNLLVQGLLTGDFNSIWQVYFTAGALNLLTVKHISIRVHLVGIGGIGLQQILLQTIGIN